MPRAKRPLAEADPNASNASNRNAKSAKTKGTETAKNKENWNGSNGKRDTSVKEHKEPAKGAHEESHQHLAPVDNTHTSLKLSGWRWSTRHAVFNAGQDSKCVQSPELNHGSNNEERNPLPASSSGEKIDYRSKDNSKLRSFLLDRDLPTTGTREELISRLESSSIDYETLPSGKLTEMLKARHVTMASQGTKETKIERLRLNDMLEWDTGNSAESVLYGRFSAIELALDESIANQGRTQDNANSTYESLPPGKLSKLLEKRNLSRTGSHDILIKRLKDDDRKTIAKFRAAYESRKLELESRRGRPLEAGEVEREVFEKGEKLRALDSQIQLQAPKVQSSIPRCEYNWKDSHWAGRTERELREICDRREMPGGGTKAAMIKWLETGQLDYEDVYVGSLRSICEKRGLHCKSTAKKVDIIKLLRAADEAESN